MAESEAIHSMANQVAIQAAIAVVVVLREVDADPRSGASTASLKEGHRQIPSRPALKQPSFNWNVTDKHVEVLNFKMEVTNLFQTKTWAKWRRENPHNK